MPQGQITDATFAGRLRKAWNRYQEREGKSLDKQDLAGVLATASGGKFTISAAGVREWFSGRTKKLKKIETYALLGRALGVSPGWLAFGEGPGPDGDEGVAAVVDQVFPPPSPRGRKRRSG